MRVYIISIHAAREGGDEFAKLGLEYRVISIHAAREGGDLLDGLTFAELSEISIHAAREGGDYMACPFLVESNISIHAAREGGDGVRYKLPRKPRYFNPRRP